MSEIEKARQNLKISGYQHPTEIIAPTSTKQYKSLNTESKEKNYVSASNKSIYATFTPKDPSNPDNQSCPLCGEDALYECECKYKDKQCSKGHVWYINKEGKIQNGDPHD